MSLLLQAKPYLEKAMKMDPSSLQPVYVMADILKQEKKYDKGIELWVGHVCFHSFEIYLKYKKAQIVSMLFLFY